MEKPGRRGGDLIARMMPKFCPACRTRTAHIQVDPPSDVPNLVIRGIMLELDMTGWRCGRCRKVNP
jgi:hypothetical protein